MKNKRPPIEASKNCFKRKVLIMSLSAMFFALSLPHANAGTNDFAAVKAVNQTSRLSGKVVDENNQPMIGVSVAVKGTTVGVITDIDGNFTLTSPENASTLVFTYLGYNSQEVSIGNTRQFSIKLTPNEQFLDEVVFIGYGSVKKRDLTGAVVSKKSDEITLAPTANVMEALQGKVSGMDIVKPSGQIGGNVEILLRGTRSIYGSNSPLFIID